MIAMPPPCLFLSGPPENRTQAVRNERPGYEASSPVVCSTVPNCCGLLRYNIATKYDRTAWPQAHACMGVSLRPCLRGASVVVCMSHLYRIYHGSSTCGIAIVYRRNCVTEL